MEKGVGRECAGTPTLGGRGLGEVFGMGRGARRRMGKKGLTLECAEEIMLGFRRCIIVAVASSA